MFWGHLQEIRSRAGLPAAVRVSINVRFRPGLLAAFNGLQVSRLYLAGSVLFNIIGHALILRQRAHSGAFDVGDMHECVGSPALGLDEAEALGLVEKFNNTCRHLTIPVIWIRVSDLHCQEQRQRSKRERPSARAFYSRPLAQAAYRNSAAL